MWFLVDLQLTSLYDIILQALANWDPSAKYLVILFGSGNLSKFIMECIDVNTLVDTALDYVSSSDETPELSNIWRYMVITLYYPMGALPDSTQDREISLMDLTRIRVISPLRPPPVCHTNRLPSLPRIGIQLPP